MNLAMRILVNIGGRRQVPLIPRQMLRAHRNHTEPLLVWVNIFNHGVIGGLLLIRVVAAAAARDMREEVIPPNILRRHPVYHVLCDKEVIRLLIHQQQRAHHPPRVITNPDFRIRIVKYHGCIYINNSAPFHQLELAIQTHRVARNSQPDAVDKHLHLAIGVARRQCFQTLNISINISVKRRRITMDGHVTQITDILDNTDTPAFRRLRWTKEPPRSIV